MFENLKSSKESVLKAVILSILSFVFALPAFAVEELALGGEKEQALISFLDPINNIILVIAAVVIIFRIALGYGRSSVGAAFLYFLYGTVLLGSIRLFIFFVDGGILPISEGTLIVWWHLLFYLAMIAFFIGAKSLVQWVSATDVSEVISFRKALWVGILFTMLTLALFFTAVPLNEAFDNAFSGSIWDRFGIQHFVAFLFAGLVTLHMLRVGRKLRKNIATIVMPLLGTFALLTVIHLWELVTESWKWIVFPEAIIESVEQIITLPAYIFIFYAFMKARKLLEGAE
ncbi:MAG: hypothetical protein KJI71_03905 [Patescibacteria group bacterium]|nr:hypothetical protein [Patescibacteria group bacterium]